MDDSDSGKSAEIEFSPENNPRKSRNGNIILIIVILAAAVLVVIVFAYFSFSKGIQNPFTNMASKTASSTTTITPLATSPAQTLSTTVTPESNISQSTGVIGCGNSCLELGYNRGVCHVSSVSSFSCASADYPGQEGKRFNLLPGYNWCAWLSVGITSEQTTGCCCFK